MKPERLGDGVRNELDRFGTAGAIAHVVAVWPDAVGKAIADNAWPARLARDGTLHVSTASSAWSFELGLLEAKLVDRLAEALGASAPPRLRFAPGPLPERGGEGSESGSEARRERAPAVTEQHRFAAEELAAPIEDKNLRKLVARAAAASLARRA